MNDLVSERWQLDQLLVEHPDLRVYPQKHPALKLRGSLHVYARKPDGFLIDDRYEVELHVPFDFPRLDATARETGSRIPPSYHTMIDGTMCLGSPARQRRILYASPTLPTFVNRLVIPYLFGHSYWERFGIVPFNELAHGNDGLLDDYMEMFGVRTRKQAIGMIAMAAMKKRIANKSLCPCGSHTRLGKCHHLKVNQMRKSLGMKWFRIEKTRFDLDSENTLWLRNSSKSLSAPE